MTINLLPWREQKIFRHSLQFCFICISSIIFISMLGLTWYLHLHALQVQQQARNFFLMQHIKKIKLTKEDYQQQHHYRNQLEQLQFIEHLFHKQNNFLQTWQALQETLPSNIKLLFLDQSNDHLKLQGETLQAHRIGRFINQLSRYHFFHQVVLQTIDKEKNPEQNNDICQFTLSATLLNNPNKQQNKKRAVHVSQKNANKFTSMASKNL